MGLIATNIQGHIGTIAFDNYAKRNALSVMLIDECVSALKQFESENVHQDEKGPFATQDTEAGLQSTRESSDELGCLSDPVRLGSRPSYFLSPAEPNSPRSMGTPQDGGSPWSM